MNIARPWILLALPLMLLGCSAMQRAPEPGLAVGAAAALEAPKPPSAQLSAPRAVADSAQALQQGPGAYLYSHDPRQLAQEVTRACEEARHSGAQDPLRSLVADLYFSGVHPGAATEALIRGNCADSSAIVEEVIAQGGREVLDSVVSRARMLGGQGANGRIESAAAAGLAAAERTLSTQELPAYGMLYFPSLGENSKLVTAIALNRLYEDAVPGYGIYTFVLLGRDFRAPSGEDVARYGEFFRMIETYVSATDEETGAPSVEAHAFLVPINPERIGSPLIDQTAFDLSEVMRRHLAQALRHDGDSAVASRLEKGAGPFLIATLEPRLPPSHHGSAWLVTDLSRVAPERLYGIVDAFDRPIPAETSGRLESLSAIRERLLRLPTQPVGNSEVKADASDWIFMLGDVTGAQALYRPALS